VAGVLQKLNLTETETALMKGICVLAPDRCDLQDGSRVEENQAQVIEALQYHISKTREDGQRAIARILAAIAEMRTPSHLHGKVKARLKDTLDTKLPPLIYEICSQ